MQLGHLFLLPSCISSLWSWPDAEGHSHSCCSPWHCRCPSVCLCPTAGLDWWRRYNEHHLALAVTSLLLSIWASLPVPCFSCNNAASPFHEAFLAADIFAYQRLCSSASKTSQGPRSFAELKGFCAPNVSCKQKSSGGLVGRGMTRVLLQGPWHWCPRGAGTGLLKHHCPLCTSEVSTCSSFPLPSLTPAWLHCTEPDACIAVPPADGLLSLDRIVFPSRFSAHA